MLILKYYRFARRFFAIVLALVSAASAVLADASNVARHYQVNGFASQGYINTDNNNFFGESSRSKGSFDYFEAGINGLVQVSDKLALSAQLLARNAGETDDGKIRVDFAFLDYRFINLDLAHAGVRLGRVKNPVGFYNESRDVIFTRPSILLPQSIYQDAVGIRDILFSSDGAQLYSNWDHGRHHTAFRMNFARNKDVTGQTRKNFLAGDEVVPGFSVGDIRVEDLFFVQIMDEVDGGRLRFAVSYFRGTLAANLQLDGSSLPPLTAGIDVDSITLSGQYNADVWSLTSEYSITSSDSALPGMPSSSRSEGAYLQGQYRFSPRWTGLLRYDIAYGDRNDRSNSDVKNVVAGLRWSPSPSWIVMGEVHYIHGSDGASSIPRIDNTDQMISNRTKLFAMMVGYRF